MSMKLVFSLFLGTFAFANTNKVGNGGNIVVCTEKSKSSYELLDFYESGIKNNDSALVEKSTDQIIQVVVEKLRPASVELADQYLKRSKNILAEFDYKSDIELSEVKDSLHAFKPKSANCKVVQTIIRKDKVVEKEKRFLVDENVWKKLDSFQKAGLILHEIIYEHFSKLGEKDSIKARKLNSYLFRNKIKPQEFWLFIKDLDIAIYP